MQSRPLNNLGLLLSVQAIALMIVVGSIPILWPLGQRLEGQFFPVVENVRVREVEHLNSDGEFILQVDVTFDKVRNCDLVGLYWFNKNGGRIPLVFPTAARTGDGPVTRPTGTEQTSTGWALIGLTSLEGSYAVVEHRCHPLWRTFTSFYP